MKRIELQIRLIRQTVVWPFKNVYLDTGLNVKLGDCRVYKTTVDSDQLLLMAT